MASSTRLSRAAPVLLAAAIGGLCGMVLTAGAAVHASDPPVDLKVKVEAFSRATIMAIGSLAVDTESNARAIADLRGKIAELRRELAEARKSRP